MHSTIYELSERPISENQRVTVDDMPEWFFQTVADYAADMDNITRAVQIHCLEQCFGNLCIWNEDQLRFSNNFKERYFRENYRYFMAAVNALAHTDYTVFAGIITAPAFDAAFNGIVESYADKTGFYIYDSDHRELLPLDVWLRKADLSKPYFLGGIMDYHNLINLKHGSVANLCCG